MLPTMLHPMTLRNGDRLACRQLRVCLCVSLFRPAFGGAEQQAERLAHGLVALGHRVTVVTQRLPGAPPEEDLNGVRVVRTIRPWNRGPIYGVSYVISLAAFLLRSRGSFDLIQATYLYLDAFTALVLRPILRTPVILRPACGGVYGDLSRLPTLRFVPLWPRLNRPIHNMVLRILQRADAVVALSRELADELAAARFPPEGILCIPNCVDHRRFAPANEIQRRAQQAALNLAEPVLTFVGRLHAQKSLATLLQAIARLHVRHPRIHLLLVGEGPEGPALRSLATTLRLNDRTLFVGGVADVTPYLAATDIFVHPSLAEGMPGALLEAMAAGLPCVATRIGGTVDVITDGVDGLLVEPGNAEELADALGRLLEEPAVAGKLGAAARRTVESRFTIDVVAARYAEAYARVICAASNRLEGRTKAWG